MGRSLSAQTLLQLGKLDFSGLPMHLLHDLEVSLDDGVLKVPPPVHSAYPTEFSQQPLEVAAAGVGGGAETTLPSSYPARQSSGTSSSADDSSGSGSGSSSEDIFKCVINVKNCPICHRTRKPRWTSSRTSLCARAGTGRRSTRSSLGILSLLVRRRGSGIRKSFLRFLVGIILGVVCFHFFPLFEFAV